MVVDDCRFRRVRHAHPPTYDTDRKPRRTVALEGFGLLPDGTTFAISVSDLSYDGCKIHSELALLPGLELKLSILGLGGALDATVRWCKDGSAGLQFSKYEASQDSRVPRTHERIELEGDVSIRRSGSHHYQCQLIDVTSRGCKIEFVERPRPGETLWAKFAGLDSIEATVRWVDGAHGGLEFVRPIYPAVFELLIARLRD